MYSDPENPDREVFDEEKQKWISAEKKRIKVEVKKRVCIQNHKNV